MTGNHSRGFDGFQARIEAVTEMLGGTPFARMEVERRFAEALQRALQRRLGGNARRRIDAFRETWWTEAKDEDFAAAIQAEARFRGHAPEPEAVRWRIGPVGGDAVLRGADLWLETEAGGRVLLAFGAQNGPRSWRVGMTNSADDLLSFLGRLGPDPIQRFWSEREMLRGLRRIAAVHLAAP